MDFFSSVSFQCAFHGEKKERGNPEGFEAPNVKQERQSFRWRNFAGGLNFFLRIPTAWKFILTRSFSGIKHSWQILFIKYPMKITKYLALIFFEEQVP